MSGSAEPFLERIVAASREELVARKASVPLEKMRERAALAPAPRDFVAALRPRATGPARLIAEIKRASPSRGLLAEDFDPVERARAYVAGGAAVISVLTEPRYFLGALEHLTAVRAAVDVPVLRKDFIIDPYQVYEARAAGADAALLIMALLDDALAADLLAHIRALGMEALVEAHTSVEVYRAVQLGASVIGVNSRDLRTFRVDVAHTRYLRSSVPTDRVFITESGINDSRGATQARAWGADAILVGEALMRADDPEAKARELSTAPGGAMAALFNGTGWPFVKICGLTTPEQAQYVASLGADAFGLVFAPMAPDHRRVTVEQAERIVGALPTTADQRLRTMPVGVFVNPDIRVVATAVRRARLGAVQLSGDETPEQCARIAREVGVRVIKALRLRSEADLKVVEAYIAAGVTPLLDTPAPGLYGGAGETGDWSLARRVAAEWPIMLAGGLTPSNVVDAIETVAPRGVDVSSGVETERAKNLGLIEAFIAMARSA